MYMYSRHGGINAPLHKVPTFQTAGSRQPDKNLTNRFVLSPMDLLIVIKFAATSGRQFFSTIGSNVDNFSSSNFAIFREYNGNGKKTLIFHLRIFQAEGIC
jgi:hypothetical protein